MKADLQEIKKEISTFYFSFPLDQFLFLGCFFNNVLSTTFYTKTHISTDSPADTSFKQDRQS